LADAKFVEFLEMVKSNSTAFHCDGKILRLKRFIPPGAGSLMLDLVIDALAYNTRVEILYIQNFERGFLDEQLEKLTEVLKLKRIWGLNVGENFNVSMPAWEKFTVALSQTAVTHMYASEHHFRGTDLKVRMRDAIRANRGKHLTPKPHSLEAIMQCGNMWYNPKLPSWASGLVSTGDRASLLAKQQQASKIDTVGGLQCQAPPGTAQWTLEKEKQKEARILTRTPGKRSVVRTERCLEFQLEVNEKQRRMHWNTIVRKRQSRKRTSEDATEHEIEDVKVIKKIKPSKQNKVKKANAQKRRTYEKIISESCSAVLPSIRSRSSRTINLPARFQDSKYESEGEEEEEDQAVAKKAIMISPAPPLKNIPAQMASIAPSSFVFKQDLLGSLAEPFSLRERENGKRTISISKQVSDWWKSL